MRTTKNTCSGINTLSIPIRSEDNNRDIGGFMRLITPLSALKNAISDIWRMHDFNYQLPKDQNQDYWEKECIDHPTSSHCKVY